MIVDMHRQYCNGEMGQDEEDFRTLIDSCMDQCQPQDVDTHEWMRETRDSLVVHATDSQPNLYFKMTDATTPFTLTKLLSNDNAIMTTVREDKTEEPLSIIPAEVRTDATASQSPEPPATGSKPTDPDPTPLLTSLYDEAHP